MKHILRVCVPPCLGAHECDESKTDKNLCFCGKHFKTVPKHVKVGDVGINPLSRKDIHLVCNYQNRRTLVTRHVLAAVMQSVITHSFCSERLEHPLFFPLYTYLLCLHLTLCQSIFESVSWVVLMALIYILLLP